MQYNAVNRKVQSVQAWLDSDTDASWEKLVAGLKQIGMGVVAKSVESAFVPKPEISVVSSSASMAMSPIQPVSTAAQLETASVAPIPIPSTVECLDPAITTTGTQLAAGRVAEVKAAIEDKFSDLKSDT